MNNNATAQLSRRPGLQSMRLMAGLVIFCVLCGQLPLRAQSTVWDSLLSNSEWYVPTANLLAYLTPGTDLSTPIPISDQTIWQIGTATNGIFTGTSTATFQLGDATVNSVTQMNGLITDAGQVRIAFSFDSAPTTVGIGQVRDIDNETYLQMQMMTGAGSLFITHWAYMAKADGDPPVNGPELLSPQWNWIHGTAWEFSGWQLGGVASAGTFLIDKYVNGYFWGSGTSDQGNFTLIGSATPEGNLLFNTLHGTTLTSLTGMISGDASNGQMAARSYQTDDSFGTLGYANVIPEPQIFVLLILSGFAVMTLRQRRRPDRPARCQLPNGMGTNATY